MVVRRILVFLVALVTALPAQAIVLEVRRSAIIKATPESGGSHVGRVEGSAANPLDVFLVGLERENGYYHVFVPNSDSVGWIHKSRGRLRIEEARDTISRYDRDSYEHWIDEDNDCQDTRAEALIRSSTTPAVLTSSDCSVISGTWVDPYTGDTFTNPGDLDVDHMVPLENVHLSGGWNWTRERQREYANNLVDSDHLLVVKDSENQSKGGKGPDEYMPPDSSFHCEYVASWIRIKRDWGLKMTVNEAEATFRVHFSCPQ